MVDWVRWNALIQRNGLIARNSVFRRPWFGISGFRRVTTAAKPTYD
jgi:hypothetical protein